jgi:hypothetical protein
VAVSALILGLLGAFASAPAPMGNGRIELLKMPRVVARADSRPAETATPRVSIPDGPLQNPRYATARRSTEALADEGSGVLLPSAAPGLDWRRQGPACGTISTDAMWQCANGLPAQREGLIQHACEYGVWIGYGAGGLQSAAMPDVNAGPGVAGKPGSCARSCFRQDVTAMAHQRSCLDWNKERLGVAVSGIDSTWLEARGADVAPLWSILAAVPMVDTDVRARPARQGV